MNGTPYPLLDLFSGYGGFSLAFEAVAHAAGARRAGTEIPGADRHDAGQGAWGQEPERGSAFRTIGFSEIEPYACALLAHRFPGVPNLGPVQSVTRDRVLRECGVLPVVVTGGFPCQPHSTAGKRLAGADDRDLWAECVRVLREFRPRVAVFENVPGLLTSKSPAPDGRDGKGLFFNRVLSDLAEIGFACAWETLSAAQVGAPHKRDRIWLVCVDELADAHGQQRGAGCGQPDTGPDGWDDLGGDGAEGVPADPAGERAGGRSGVRGTERGPRRALLGESGSAGEEGGGLADRLGAGLEGQPRPVDVGGQEPGRVGPGPDGPTGAASVCGGGGCWPAAHGLWPARPGEAQYEWENPRTVGHSAHHHRGSGVSGTETGVGADGERRRGLAEPSAGNGETLSHLGRAFDGSSDRLDPAPAEVREAQVNQKGQPMMWPTPDTQNARDGTHIRADNNLAVGGLHGISLHHAVEHPDSPFRSTVTAISTDTVNRTQRLKALGNGIVPAVAFPFAVAIRNYLDGAA